MLTAGIDEVGRGPLAGPVLAAAVVLPKKYSLEGLTDSKTLSVKKRDALAKLIRQQALCWSVGRADVEEIDKINILQATLLAMKRAVQTLAWVPDVGLVDGKWAPELPCETHTIVKGDLTEPAISAASIIAKVERDREMRAMNAYHPGYGFDANKGYATAQHLNALKQRGPCSIHRKSFAPVRIALGKSWLP